LTPRAGPVARARGSSIPTRTPSMFATRPLHQKATRQFKQVRATRRCRALAVGFPKLLVSNTFPLVRSCLTSADNATVGVLLTIISAVVQRMFNPVAVRPRERRAAHPSQPTPIVTPILSDQVLATSSAIATTRSPETLA